MSYQVINPFIQFVDPINGKPLSGGSVYFGRQDSDPKNQPANRINVYAVQDNGTEVLLAQPITLNGAGQPQYSGSVKQLRIDLYGPELAYSVQVFSSSGSQKGYSSRVYAPADLKALADVDSTILIGGIEAGKIGRYVDGLKNLKPKNNMLQTLSSIYVGGQYGGMVARFDSAASKASNGKIVGDTLFISPEAIAAWDGTAANVSQLFGWTGSGSGAYKLQAQKFNACHFGADPTGSQDSSPHLSYYAKAHDGNGGYGLIYLVAGSYRINSPIQNLTSKINIQGDGSSCTFLNTYLSAGQRALAFSGLAASTNAYTAYKGFAAVAQNSLGTAIQAADAAYCHFEDVRTENFALHWELDSVLTSVFTKCVGRFGPANAIGVYGSNSGSSNPNALTFIGCTFSSFSGPAVYLLNPSRLSYIGGSLESCGTAGGITGQGALVIENGGGQGAAAAYIQTYFEGNGGIADVWIKQYGSTPFSVDVANSCFNRLPAPRYAENCVRLTQSAGTGFVSLRVGNASTFQGFNGYTPDISRKYISVDSATSNFKFLDEGSNFYKSDLETPQIAPPALVYGASIDIDMQKYSSHDYAYLEITNGSAFTINNPTNGNVNDVLRIFMRNSFATPAGAVTFGSFYRLGSAFTAPTLNHGAIIEFRCSPNGLWVESGRSTGFAVV